jgi:hypothetical protein
MDFNLRIFHEYTNPTKANITPRKNTLRLINLNRYKPTVTRKKLNK